MAASTSSTILINLSFLIQSTDFKALYISLLHKPVKISRFNYKGFLKMDNSFAMEVYFLYPARASPSSSHIQNCFTLFLNGHRSSSSAAFHIKVIKQKMAVRIFITKISGSNQVSVLLK
jgi:hypothetical protein